MSYATIAVAAKIARAAEEQCSCVNSSRGCYTFLLLRDHGGRFGDDRIHRITGAGTSIGAIGGALTIARWRVLAIVIGTLWAGSMLIGFSYNFIVL